jgi:hypothetical protein
MEGSEVSEEREGTHRGCARGEGEISRHNFPHDFGFGGRNVMKKGGVILF